jgi:hypothetical protein
MDNILAESQATPTHEEDSLFTPPGSPTTLPPSPSRALENVASEAYSRSLDRLTLKRKAPEGVAYDATVCESEHQSAAVKAHGPFIAPTLLPAATYPSVAQMSAYHSSAATGLPPLSISGRERIVAQAPLSSRPTEFPIPSTTYSANPFTSVVPQRDVHSEQLFARSAVGRYDYTTPPTDGRLQMRPDAFPHLFAAPLLHPDSSLSRALCPRNHRATNATPFSFAGGPHTLGLRATMHMHGATHLDSMRFSQYPEVQGMIYP